LEVEKHVGTMYMLYSCCIAKPLLRWGWDTGMIRGMLGLG